MKKILRMGAILLLMATVLCACNSTPAVSDEATKESSTSATTATTATTATSATQPSGESNDQENAGGNTPQTPRKKVAITFDDGPDDVNTKLLVDELNRYGFNATFFVIGTKIDGTRFDGSEVLKYVVDNGNEIGVHSYTHSINYGSECSDATYASEISKTEDAIHTVLPDYDIKLMRPVEGIMTDERVAGSKYPVIHWNIDTYDWKYTSQEQKWTNVGIVVDTVKSRIKEGDIVLMHEIHDNSLEAAIVILEWLYYNGYEVVTVSELLGENAQSGVRYYSAN